jgi:hypothetical protein
MATCDVCGRKLALLGRAAAKNHRRVAGLVGDLRRVQAAVLQEAESEGNIDAEELARFRGNTDRLIADGERRPALADYLGHSDPGFTLRTYTHLMPSSEDRTRQAVDAAFSSSRAQRASNEAP